MRISEIKGLTDNQIIRRCISYFWEIEIYHKALLNLSKDCTIDDVYYAIREVFLCDIETEDFQKKRQYDMRSLSKAIYGDPNCWMNNTKWEIIAAEREAKKKLRQESLDSLTPLYMRLLLSPKHSPDIIKLISGNSVLAQEIIRNIDSINTRKDLFEICKRVLEEDNTRELNNRDYWIMRCSSSLAQQPFDSD